MKLTPKVIDISTYPPDLAPYLTGVTVFDSSCSPNAKVLFLDKDGGYFLKSAPKGTLLNEMKMTEYFYEKGLSAKVLSYVSNEKDYMLTGKVNGDDCTTSKYLSNPKRLCDTMAERLLLLHSSDYENCPVPNHTEKYLKRAKNNYFAKIYDIDLFPDNWGYKTPDEAFDVIREKGHLLKTDTLLHGDYCLPNIILDNWKFSGFIDLDSGGVGDRHVDIFWAIWTLFFNLKTNTYRQRFIDAYGRDKIDEEMLRLIAAIEIFS